MKINIILITYNQESYIRQTLDSILNQNINEDNIEMIIADDCSTDNTLSIIEEYSKHCKKANFAFNFLKNTRNLGYIKNYERAFNACDGDYIAIIEGDDYWITDNHIKQHAEFLEAHQECSMSFNRHIRLFEGQNMREEIVEWVSPSDVEYFTTEQMIQGNKIGNLSCCVFRTSLIKNLNSEIFEIVFADWLLGMIMGQYGYLAYQKEITSVYRIHDKGQWSKMGEVEQAKNMIKQLKVYNQLLNYKYNKEFSRKIKSLEICLYGDNSIKGRIKKIIPNFIKKLYWKYL